MKHIALGALLLVLPFGGIRVMCFEAPVADRQPATVAEALSDCERMCPLHPPEERDSAPPAHDAAGTSDSEEGCALSSGASTLTALGTIAVLRAEQALHVPVSVAIARIDAPRFYSEPVLTRLAPPPKPQAL